MNLKKMLGIGAIAGLVGIGAVTAMYSPAKLKDDLPVSSTLMDSLRYRQFIKDNFVPGYDATVDWLDSPYEKQVDSIMAENQKDWYL